MLDSNVNTVSCSGKDLLLQSTTAIQSFIEGQAKWPSGERESRDYEGSST